MESNYVLVNMIHKYIHAKRSKSKQMFHSSILSIAKSLIDKLIQLLLLSLSYHYRVAKSRLIFFSHVMNMDQTNIPNPSNKHAYISIDKPVAMMDEAIHISISNLKPWQKITIVAQIEDGHALYTSYAHYIADQNRIVNLTTDPSLDGTYQGVDSMGMLWSMRPTKDKEHVMLYLNDINRPLHVRLFILNGFRNTTSWNDVQNDIIIAERSIERWYIASDVIN